MKTILAFKRGAVVHPGLNCTVRKGRKWALKVTAGMAVDLVTEAAEARQPLENRTFGEATIVSNQFIENLDSVFDLPQIALRFNHAPGARTYEGMDAAMVAAYGEGWWLDGATLVFFWVS